MPEKKLPSDNASSLSGTRLRVQDYTPISGLCALCIPEKCPFICEVSKAALRGREALYPEAEEFGFSTAAASKDYGLDWSDIQLLPNLTEFYGVKGDELFFEDINVEAKFAGISLKLPVFIAALGSTDIAKKHWVGLAVGAAISGSMIVVGENVCGMDEKAVFSQGRVQHSPELERRVKTFREYWDGTYGDVAVQTNVEDEMMNVDFYALSKLEVNTIEKKFGQGAKSIGGEVRISNIERAIELKRRGYIVIPDPEDDAVKEAYKRGLIKSFERHSRVKRPDVSSFLERVDKLRENGAKRILIKTGAYRPAAVAFTMKLASMAKADGVTFDGAGGGTGMSPILMMNESGVPTLYLEVWTVKAAQILSKRGAHVPDIAMAGGFSNEHHIVKAIALSGFEERPYVKAVAMARTPILAVAKSKYMLELAKEGKLPPEVARKWGTDSTKLFIEYDGLLREYGSERFNKILESGAIGLYTYFKKLSIGIKILLAGQRKTSLYLLNRKDLAALTERAARVTGLPLIDEADEGLFETILSS
ncbi:MAG: glutamate synthase-related protein [Acidilobaceae archaeon]